MVKVLLDYQSPIGHINIINFYVKNLYNNFDEILLNKNISSYIKKRKKIKYLDLDTNIFEKVIKLKKIIEEYKSYKEKKIFFLSYEPNILLLLGIFINLRDYEIYLLEHDNLSVKKIKKLLYLYLLPKSFYHLVYTKTSLKFLSKTLKRKNYFFTPHPLSPDDKYGKKIYENRKKLKLDRKINNILIPTRHHFDLELIKNISEQNKECLFVVLTKKSNIKKEIYKNIKNIKPVQQITEEDLFNFSALYLPLNSKYYQYRISAWLYKGILFNKIIYMEEGSLYKFEKSRFPNNIFRYNGGKLTKIKRNVKNYSKLKNYNAKLISDLKYILKV